MKPNRIVIETERFDPLIYAVRAERPDQVVVIVRSLGGGVDEVYGGPGGYAIEPLAALPARVEFEVVG